MTAPNRPRDRGSVPIGARVITMPRPASRYVGLRCTSVSRDGVRCEREAGHTEVRGRVGQLHRAAVNGLPAVWSERD